MAYSPSEAFIAAVYASSSASELLRILRQLKNSIVGHDQRKEIAIKTGVLEPLVHILASGGSVIDDEKSTLESSGVALADANQDADVQEVRVQAALVLASLASGDLASCEPLLAARVPEALLQALSTDGKPTLYSAILQALKNVVSRRRAATQANDGAYVPFELFTRDSTAVFDRILLNTARDAAGRKQQWLVADIIAIAADSTVAKASLVDSPVLETLASLLASHSLASKHVDYHAAPSHFPPPPPPASIPSIMSAITAIISGSTYRVHRFFLAPALRDLFSSPSLATGDQRHRLGPCHGLETRAGEPLLPPLHIPAYGTTSYYGGYGGHYAASRAFPALSGLQRGGRWNALAEFGTPLQSGDADHANAVCGWLLFFARSMHGIDRLVALRLLAWVNNVLDVDLVGTMHRSEYLQKSKEREKQIALLAVPLAVKLVQIGNEAKSADAETLQETNAQTIRQQACEVLALLIRQSKELQVAAVDAGAIKHVCPCLKKSFDNVTLSKPMWSPRSADLSSGELSASRVMGTCGLPPEILQAMETRKGALEAIAALTDKEDLHRKAVVDAGVVSSIIESLRPFASDPNGAGFNPQLQPRDGNTTRVIRAACSAAKSMSRSVSLLRTSLIDAGIAKPMVQLLAHPHPEVQLEATNVCANLLLDFSPMREDLVNEGVVKLLTEHARQSTPLLQLSSLWALKHLMLSSTRDIKVHTLDELGAGWLVAAIQGEQRENAQLGGGVSVGLSTPNAAGEQVNLLNPSSMDVDDSLGADVEGALAEQDNNGEAMFDEASGTPYHASELRSTLQSSVPEFDRVKYLATVRAVEFSPTLRARRDDVDVQEQALDFVRNLLTGDDCAAMFEHLMQQIGRAKIFDLLTTKLAPLPSSLRSATGSTTAGGRQIYNTTELILSSVHIINHISNAQPRHKQMLIAQRPLLQAWLPHFNHVDRRVRVTCVWAVSSLTWVEDDSDRREARQRALELRAVGIEAAVRGLAGDTDLDVRERVRTASRQMDMLL